MTDGPAGSGLVEAWQQGCRNDTKVVAEEQAVTRGEVLAGRHGVRGAMDAQGEVVSAGMLLEIDSQAAEAGVGGEVTWIHNHTMVEDDVTHILREDSIQKAGGGFAEGGREVN